ncbi:unnamed protein product [Vitrella brassicaformis CCMP3155]|uniref:Mei2-like C-terminal RNA recognition motif domain-containing protein n=3 Tax=Vitrella brassicaformis TaxID=1169539 RepID=A0A0G4ESW1_VITBC|nr:unnamed protein product [Vitrella brassicaformis CCMP3155]|eukprot:CEM00906.1 unnamed protein product [Vitrella brassicaformis CCMP3155]
MSDSNSHQITTADVKATTAASAHDRLVLPEVIPPPPPTSKSEIDLKFLDDTPAASNASPSSFFPHNMPPSPSPPATLGWDIDEATFVTRSRSSPDACSESVISIAKHMSPSTHPDVLVLGEGKDVRELPNASPMSLGLNIGLGFTPSSTASSSSIRPGPIRPPPPTPELRPSDMKRNRSADVSEGAAPRESAFLADQTGLSDSRYLTPQSVFSWGLLDPPHGLAATPSPPGTPSPFDTTNVQPSMGVGMSAVGAPPGFEDEERPRTLSHGVLATQSEPNRTPFLHHGDAIQMPPGMQSPLPIAPPSPMPPSLGGGVWGGGHYGRVERGWGDNNEAGRNGHNTTNKNHNNNGYRLGAKRSSDDSPLPDWAADDVASLSPDTFQFLPDPLASLRDQTSTTHSSFSPSNPASSPPYSRNPRIAVNTCRSNGSSSSDESPNTPIDPLQIGIPDRRTSVEQLPRQPQHAAWRERNVLTVRVDMPPRTVSDGSRLPRSADDSGGPLTPLTPGSTPGKYVPPHKREGATPRTPLTPLRGDGRGGRRPPTPQERPVLPRKEGWGHAVETYVGEVSPSHPDYVPMPNMDGLVDTTEGKTTVMWRNIPCKYTVSLLKSIVDPQYKGLYDFFYLPIDFRNKRNIGYAFLNFLHPSFADSFTKQFNGHKLSHFKSNKVSEVCWAHIQGLDANIDHFRNSALMSVPNPDHKPILFRNGVAQPFPAPTRDRPPTRERDTPSTATHTHRSAALAEAPTRRFVQRDDYGKGYGHHQHHHHPAHHLMEYGSPWGSNGDRDSTGKRRFIPVHGHHREHSHTGGGRPDNRRD